MFYYLGDKAPVGSSWAVISNLISSDSCGVSTWQMIPFVVGIFAATKIARIGW